MSYLIYLRKSRKDVELEQYGDEETLARHERILLDLAKTNGYEIGAIYREVVSGETISARPEMQRLISEVEQGLWDGVLVMEVERLARGDTIDQGIVARAFKLSSTKIVTPVKTYDPDNEYDEEYFEFGLFMSRREYKTINRRIQRGRVSAAKEGKYVSSTPPYGYDRVKLKDKGYSLAANGESDVVKSIFAWYLQGDGCSVIARRLDDMHVPTRSGRPWSKATIRDIIRNPVYAGKIRFGYRQIKKGTESEARVINEDALCVDGVHEALIDQDAFDRAQYLMTHSARLPVKLDTTLKNPFTGLAVCGKCGSRMTRLGVNSHCCYATLKCSNRYCDNVSAPIYLIEHELIKQISQYMDGYLVQLKNMMGNDAPDKAAEKALFKANGELMKIKKQLSSLYDLLEQGIYTVDIFTQRNKDLSERKKHLEQIIAQLEDKEAQRCAQEELIHEIPALSRALDGYYYSDSAKLKNVLLRKIISKFEYVKNEANFRGARDNANFRIEVYPRFPKL